LALQHLEELLGGRQLVDRNTYDVVVPVDHLVLVEVVTDARAVGEELLDGDALVDQGKIVAEHRSRRGVEAELTALDEAHIGQGGEAFRAAGDRELRVDRRRDAEAPMREAICTLEDESAVEVDPNDARQALVGPRDSHSRPRRTRPEFRRRSLP
jgi:hypothetical protein